MLEFGWRCAASNWRRWEECEELLQVAASELGREPTGGEMGDDLPTDQELDRVQWTTVLYDLHETNPDNGLVRDKTDPTAPSSIAAVGLALAGLPVIAERGVISRPFAAKIARRRLRFLHDLPQGPEPDAAGYKGFFYHFLAACRAGVLARAILVV
jgi:hypothetical protein